MSKVNRETILSEIKKIICNDRNEQYGEPENSFEKIADYWTTYLKHNCIAPDADCDLGARDVAILMALFKLGRMETSYFASYDSFIDAIGYMTCATDCEFPKAKLKEYYPTERKCVWGKPMQIIKIIVAILLYGYAVGYFIGAFALYEAPNAKPVKPKIKAMMYGQIAVEIIAATLLLKN